MSPPWSAPVSVGRGEPQDRARGGENIGGNQPVRRKRTAKKAPTIRSAAGPGQFRVSWWAAPAQLPGIRASHVTLWDTLPPSVACT